MKKNLVLSIMLLFVGILSINSSIYEKNNEKQQQIELEKKSEINDFKIKQTYADKYDAIYLGNNIYKDSKGVYYKAEYNNKVSYDLGHYKEGVYAHQHTILGYPIKIVIKNNKKHHSKLTGRVIHVGFIPDHKEYEFGEKTPTDDYDIYGYNGDGNTGDSKEGKEWVFGSDTYQYQNKLLRKHMSINVVFAPNELGGVDLTTIMQSVPWPKDNDKSLTYGQVKKYDIYYDSLYSGKTIEELK